MLNKTFTGVMLLSLSLFLAVLPGKALAADPKHDNETTVFDKTFSWQFMGGMSVVYDQSPIKGDKQSQAGDYLHISLLFDLYYKGFFMQSNHRRAAPATLGGEIGYELIVEENWELDIINKAYVPGYQPSTIIDNDDDLTVLSDLEDRDFGHGIGLRYSRFYQNSVLSVDVASLAPLSKADGWVADVFYSHLVPYRNWDIYFGAGLTYYSADVTDYFVGVNQDEVSTVRSYYRPGSSYQAELEVFAQHPISQNWFFNAGITQSYYSSAIKNSPLIGKQHTTQVMLGVLYVF
jgi:outer membrane scaffolding protein for murein synthesis (MipA/OmpV family)